MNILNETRILYEQLLLPALEVGQDEGTSIGLDAGEELHEGDFHLDGVPDSVEHCWQSPAGILEAVTSARGLGVRHRAVDGVDDGTELVETGARAVHRRSISGQSFTYDALQGFDFQADYVAFHRHD